MLAKKKILIGITGSISAYKIISLIRLLIKQGAEIRVVMTAAAVDFVSPIVLSTLSKHKVYIEWTEGSDWNNHVQLGRWPDLMLIAPLTANTLSKMANGSCDNLLMATYLSATCKAVVAPAMDEDMWHHPTVKRNLNQLIADGIHVIPPASGELASGLIGEGRLAEPEDILRYIKEHFFIQTQLKGKRVLVTAGPTQEPIDAVRFIANRSTGKMGYAIAQSLYEYGADVMLVSGPSSEKIYYDGIHIKKVTTASEMFQACKEELHSADIIIMNAAVADFTVVSTAENKIKKTEQSLMLDLVPTIDILSWFGEHKRTDQILIGFALETDNELENATNKMLKKNLDAIILNSLQDPGAGFEKDTNKITIIDKIQTKKTELSTKKEIAGIIAAYIIGKINA